VPLNASPERRDLAYLRRRVKPAPVAQEAVQDAVQPAEVRQQPAPARQSTGLTLGGPSATPPAVPATPAAPATTSRAATPPPAAQPAVPQPFPAPTAEEVRVLDDETPLVRLDARQSAIGSLIVGGATAIVWESAELVTGLATADGVEGTPVDTPGNRPLLGFDDADAILTLRHVRLIRRALFVGAPGRPLTVQLFDGESFAAASDDPAQAPVLSLLRIGPRVELRIEPLPAPLPLPTLLQQFGFEPTPYVVTRDPRRR